MDKVKQTRLTCLTELNISEPEVIAPGVYKTYLTHPLLEGSLSFVHGEANKEITLDTINLGLRGEITKVVSLIGDLAYAAKSFGKADPKTTGT